jgi:IS30 family transposase
LHHFYQNNQCGLACFFLDASWERGSNENLNGLLRQYVTKKRAMTFSDEEIRMIQNRLNNRPRKELVFKTPSEVFHQSLKRIALRT